MWTLFKPFLPALLVASTIVALGLIIAARLRSAQSWACAAALALAYVGGHAMTIARWPALPPVDSIDWLLYFALGTLIFPILEVLRAPSSGWLRWLVWAAFSGSFLSALLRPKFRYGWSVIEGWLWLGGLLAIMLFLAWCLETIVVRSSARIALPLILAIIMGGTAIALLVSGSILLGQLASIVEVTILVAFVIGCWIPTLLPSRGAVPVLTTLFTGLLVCGTFYSELPVLSAALLIIAPGATLIPVNRKNGGKAATASMWVHAGLVSVTVAMAVVLALHSSPPLEY